MAALENVWNHMTELTTKGVQGVANERFPKECKNQKYLLISLKNCLLTCVVF